MTWQEGDRSPSICEEDEVKRVTDKLLGKRTAQEAIDELNIRLFDWKLDGKFNPRTGFVIEDIYK